VLPTPGFSPYDALPDRESTMDTMRAADDADRSTHSTVVKPYMLAMRKWHKDADEVRWVSYAWLDVLPCMRRLGH
jgi:hypothetical protein